MTSTRVVIDNFVNIEHADFELAKSFYLVTGKNNVSTGSESNGAGKTMFLESIYYCLFGSSLRGINAGGLIGPFGSSVSVSIEFEKNNCKYKIVRGRNSSGKSSLSIYKNDEEIQFQKIEYGQEEIYNILDMTPAQCAISMYVGEYRQHLLDITPAERTKILLGLIDFDSKTYNGILEWVKNSINKMEKKVIALETKKDTAAVERDGQLALASKMPDRAKATLDERRRAMEAATEQLETARSALSNYRAEPLAEEYPGLEYSDVKSKLTENLEEQKRLLEIIDREVDEVMKRISEKKSEINESKNASREIFKKLKDGYLDFVKSITEEYIKECNSKYIDPENFDIEKTDGYSISALIKQRRFVDTKSKELMASIKKSKDLISAYNDKVKDLDSDIKKIENKITRFNKELENFSEDYKCESCGSKLDPSTKIEHINKEILSNSKLISERNTEIDKFQSLSDSENQNLIELNRIHLAYVEDATKINSAIQDRAMLRHLHKIFESKIEDYLNSIYESMGHHHAIFCKKFMLERISKISFKNENDEYELLFTAKSIEDSSDFNEELFDHFFRVVDSCVSSDKLEEKFVNLLEQDQTIVESLKSEILELESSAKKLIEDKKPIKKEIAFYSNLLECLVEKLSRLKANVENKKNSIQDLKEKIEEAEEALILANRNMRLKIVEIEDQYQNDISEIESSIVKAKLRKSSYEFIKKSAASYKTYVISRFLSSFETSVNEYLSMISSDIYCKIYLEENDTVNICFSDSSKSGDLLPYSVFSRGERTRIKKIFNQIIIEIFNPFIVLSDETLDGLDPLGIREICSFSIKQNKNRLCLEASPLRIEELTEDDCRMIVVSKNQLGERVSVSIATEEA